MYRQRFIIPNSEPQLSDQNFPLNGWRRIVVVIIKPYFTIPNAAWMLQSFDATGISHNVSGFDCLTVVMTSHAHISFNRVIE